MKIYTYSLNYKDEYFFNLLLMKLCEKCYMDNSLEG